MTIDRFNRLCRHSAKCRPISWNWRPIRKLGRYPAQVHHIRECAHRISTPREADQKDAIARHFVGKDLVVAVDHILSDTRINSRLDNAFALRARYPIAYTRAQPGSVHQTQIELG